MPFQPAARSRSGRYGGCATTSWDRLIFTTMRNGTRKKNASHRYGTRTTRRLPMLFVAIAHP
jgi:hypothetical protein